MNIVIIGNYGAKNVGDELILEGLLSSVRRIKPAAKITVLSADPANTKEKFEVDSVYKFPAGLRSAIKYTISGNLSKTKKRIKKCDYVIVGGGGLFDDSSFKAIFIWAVQTTMAYLLKKKVIMYGQSIKKPKSKLAQHIIKKLFKKASFIAVRDEDSKKILKKLIRGKKIHLMPDLIFKLDPKFKQAKENRILVCLNFDTGLMDLTKFLNLILKEEKDLTIDFLPFERDLDDRYHLKVIEGITEKNRTNKLDFTEKRQKIEKIFSESKLIVGARLHSILMAINTETPFIAINYNPKVRNLLETLKLTQFIIEPKELELRKFHSLYEKIKRENQSITKKLKQIKESQSKKHDLIEESLKKLLD